MRTIARTVAAALTVVAVAVLAGSLLGFPSIGNPFAETREYHDHAVVVGTIEELGELHAASGSFQVIVDVEDSTRFVPGFLKGERTTFLAEGTVAGVIDLRSLDEESVIVGDDNSVTVILPTPTLADPVIDHEASGVIDRDRGVLDRIGGVFSDNPTSEKDLYIEAERQMASAAAQSGVLLEARTSAETVVRQLLLAAGVEDVRVVFAEPAAAA